MKRLLFLLIALFVLCPAARGQSFEMEIHLGGGETVTVPVDDIRKILLGDSATGGDAIDSNGDFIIGGGTLVARGPSMDPEVGVDVNGEFLTDGGFLVVSGTNSMMVERPIPSSSQHSVLLRTNTKLTARTLVHLEDTGRHQPADFRAGA